MAVTAEVVLLVALISNNIQAEILLRAGKYHHFILNNTADYCSISRWSGEEETLLFNSSGVTVLPPYLLFNLDVSDSGQYQERCWTQNNVTHQRNADLLVCGHQKTRYQTLNLDVGQTAELACDGPNQSVQWALESKNHETKNVEFALIDDETSSLLKLQQVRNKSSLLVTADRPLGSITYICLNKSRHRCDVLREVNVHVLPEVIHRSLGQSLELNCSDLTGNPHVWSVLNTVKDNDVSHNYTLRVPSLTMAHTGYYVCQHSDQVLEIYLLYVSPESDPPAVVLFTGGENVTLQCGDWTEMTFWFMRSNRTEGRVLRVHPDQQGDSSVVIRNVSLEDGGEFWCVAVEDGRCVFRSKTLLMFGEPAVDHHLVRSVLLAVVIVIMCVVVATVWRTWSREQLPVPVEEVEMTEWPPARLHLETVSE